jgi:hypothetical protein
MSANNPPEPYRSGPGPVPPEQYPQLPDERSTQPMRRPEPQLPPQAQPPPQQPQQPRPLQAPQPYQQPQPPQPHRRPQQAHPAPQPYQPSPPTYQQPPPTYQQPQFFQPTQAYQPQYGPATFPPPQNPNRARNIAILVGVAVIAVIGIVVGISLSGGSSGHEVSGTYEVFSGQGCDLSDTGFSDVDEGVPVTIRDAKGNIVGSDSLSAGSDNSVNDSCVFDFDFGKVSLTSPFYDVSVGSRRGDVSFTKQEIQDDGFNLSITLGDNNTN